MCFTTASTSCATSSWRVAGAAFDEVERVGARGGGGGGRRAAVLALVARVLVMGVILLGAILLRCCSEEVPGTGAGVGESSGAGGASSAGAEADMPRAKESSEAKLKGILYCGLVPGDEDVF